MPLLLLIYWTYTIWRRRKIKKIGDPVLVRSMFRGYSPLRRNLVFFGALLTIALGCLALANPRVPDANSTEARKGIDIVFALDVSNSMLAKDVEPTRLDKAKELMGLMFKADQNDRLGLVVFAGTALVQMPLTFDRAMAGMYLRSADVNMIKTQGTSITDALQKSMVALGEDQGRFRSVILITDGETHDEGALEEASLMASRGVMINTVGLGSVQGSKIIDDLGFPKRDNNGQEVISKLNEDILKEIAAKTKGTYVHLEDAAAAKTQLQEQFKDIDKKALGDSSYYNYKSYYAWLVVPMVLLILFASLFSQRKKSTK